MLDDFDCQISTLLGFFNNIGFMESISFPFKLNAYNPPFSFLSLINTMLEGLSVLFTHIATSSGSFGRDSVLIMGFTVAQLQMVIAVIKYRIEFFII
jgi:hypothetical protein